MRDSPKASATSESISPLGQSVSAAPVVVVVVKVVVVVVTVVDFLVGLKLRLVWLTRFRSPPAWVGAAVAVRLL